MAMVLDIIPDDMIGLTFDGIVRKFREQHLWVHTKQEGEAIVHEDLKALIRADLIESYVHSRDTPLYYRKIAK